MSILWRIMENKESVISWGHNKAKADHTFLDLHNSSYVTKAKFNNCFIIHSK